MKKTSEIIVGDKSLKEILSGNKSYDLSEANLSNADLRWANLSEANLSEANMREANLSGANLSEANLSGANMRWANLSGANMREANLSNADLRWANLSEANMREANLSGANMREANLSGANMRWANLSGANLSGATGLLKPQKWLAENFETDNLGVIVYKRIGAGNTEYIPPKNWEISEGAFLEEVVNSNRTDPCGCGVNFGTREWCKGNYVDATLWKCRIRWMDLADVVVPYNTDGKARCGRLELLEIVPAVE